ncbi:Xaa-Pro peptidase family protein [Candidatus Bathyarchaeota archaeon]|nr:Xaa-Pro peptidase family protein [Candidatus Bathyarchaeota archaeon]
MSNDIMSPDTWSDKPNFKYMKEFGTMGVDWEERIDFARMRRERVEKAKDAIADSEADVLFVCRHEDARYLTGYRIQYGPVATPGLPYVVLPKGREPILYTGDWRFENMPWMGENMLKEGIHHHAYKDMFLFAESVKKQVPKLSGKCVIGIDLLNMKLLKEFQQAFPEAELVDGYAILEKAKVIKTKDEMECERQAAIITEAGLDAGIRALKPGARECEVLGEIWKVCFSLGGEWTQTGGTVCSGTYTWRHPLITTDRIIKKGDLVVFDIGSCFNGYWGDMTRTWLCGEDAEPTEAEIDLHQEAYDAQFAANNALRPGNTSYDVFVASKTPHGWPGGHGCGMHCWEEPFLADSPENAQVLRPGMLMDPSTYAWIPGVGGVACENQVFVTEGDPEIITTYPFDERLIREFNPMDKRRIRRK